MRAHGRWITRRVRRTAWLLRHRETRAATAGFLASHAGWYVLTSWRGMRRRVLPEAPPRLVPITSSASSARGTHVPASFAHRLEHPFQHRPAVIADSGEYARIFAGEDLEATVVPVEEPSVVGVR